MNQYAISVGKKQFIAKTPTVKNLKDFLRFQGDFEAVQGFDESTIQLLSKLLKSVFTGIKDANIDEMNASDLLEAANDMADWMSAALAGGKKKEQAAENGD